MSEREGQQGTVGEFEILADCMIARRKYDSDDDTHCLAVWPSVLCPAIHLLSLILSLAPPLFVLFSPCFAYACLFAVCLLVCLLTYLLTCLLTFPFR